jgi:E3 ubiquitin-protein ligase NRDP1
MHVLTGGALCEAAQQNVDLIVDLLLHKQNLITGPPLVHCIMGYDPVRFDCEVDEELKCPICCYVLETPHTSPCEHTYCNDCINEWLSRQSNCPSCRLPLTRADLKPAPRVLRNFLAKLDIKCDFACGGCPAVVKLELLQAHMDSCDFNPNKSVTCEKGCGLEMRRNQVDGHNCLSNLRDLIAKQESQITDLKQAKTVQAEQIADLRGSLKRIQEHELAEHQKQVHGLQQQISRMQNMMDTIQQKQMTLSQQQMQQQQQLQQSLRSSSPGIMMGDVSDNDLMCECDCDPSPRSCIFQQQQQQQTGSSSSLLPRKRIHNWKGKDFPAKRLPPTSASSSSAPVSGGKPCHGYGLVVDPHERSAPSPFSESEIMRHNHYHTSHGHSHHSHQIMHSPSSPADEQQHAASSNSASSSPSAPSHSQLRERIQQITFYGQVLTVSLREDEYVEDVKMKVHRLEGIPLDQQILFFAGQQLEDDRQLSHYGLFNSSSDAAKHLVLRLRDGMKIFVKTLSDKTIEVQVDPSETIEIVKVKIHEQEGISPCDQRLLTGNRDLNDMRTLSEYGIKHNSTLQLDLHLGGPCPVCQSQFAAKNSSGQANSPNSATSPSPARVSSAGKGHGHSSTSTATVATSTSSGKGSPSR